MNKEEFKTRISTDSINRLKFLLGESELFQHFLKKSTGEKDMDITNNNKKKTKEKKRRTEKEEDEELLQQETEQELPSYSTNTNTNTTSKVAITKFDESPSYIHNGVLREYQVEGLNWLISLYENGLSGILADEMGLGKTLQTISFLGYLKHYRGINGKHMILVPKSTLNNWCNEIKKWCPSFKVLLLQGTKEERQQICKTQLVSDEWEILVTSFEVCLLEKTPLRKIMWQYICIDEAHRIKNENSLLSQIMRTFQCRNRLLLTGTPLQNNLKELWALLNFLVPDVFSSYDDFDEYLQQSNNATSATSAATATATNASSGADSVIIRQLHSILRPFLLRRLKSQVEKSLLPKKRINLYIGMSDMQKEWYKKILSKDVESLNGVVKDTREGKTRLLNIVMQLRKCCNHPYLFDGAEPQPFTTDQHLVDNAGKMVLLDKLLLLLKQQGSRVLLFSQMSRMLDILEDYLVWKGYEYCRIDGQTSHEDRVRDIDEFNREGSEKFIFLLTTRAGGLGINLATADSVIMYDSDWNPQVDLQAEDRAHRIGQKKQVVVFRFVTEHAIEEKVIERAASKLRLDQLVIQQQLANNNNNNNAVAAAAEQQKLGKNDLVGMIRHGAADLFKSNSTDGNSKIMELSIEEILKKGEERTRTLEQKFQKFGLDDLQNFSLDSQNMYQFEGKDFKSGANDTGAVIAQDWIAPITKRDKGGNADALMSTGPGGGGGGGGGYQNDNSNSNKQPKPPRYMNAQEYQLYPSRLYELQKKELYAYWNEVGYRLPSTTGNVVENEMISVSIPLTDEERTEFEQLKLEGFPHWTKREYGLFLKACEKYGRDQLDAIAQEIEGKTKDEVQKYSQAFWNLYKQLSDYQAIIEKIEKGEEKIRKRHEVQQLLTKLLRQYKFPKEQLYIPYGTNTKGKNYTEEEDRFMIVQLERFGYQNEDSYERIRAEFRKDPSFRFDWFIKSRTASELARRCQTLINMLMKDQLLNVSATTAGNENQDDGMGSKESLASGSTAAATNNKRKVEDGILGTAASESSKKKK